MSVAYSYQPLKYDDSIRLLTVYGHLFSDSKEPLHCALTEVRLADEPQFLALSYAWGDPILDQHIHIQRHVGDGGGCCSEVQLSGLECCEDRPCLELVITSNLRDALLHIRQPYHDVVLWVDAVGIDQQNMSERNQQVKMMTQIYESASTVVVWLGCDDTFSSEAYDWLDSLRSELLKTMDYEDLAYRDYNSFIKAFKNLNTDKENYFDISNTEVRALLETFMRRSWWCRRWVVQEAVCARGAVIQSGHRMIEWELLEALSVALESGSFQVPQNLFLDMIYTVQSIRDISSMRQKRKSFHDASKLIYLFRTLEDSQATFPQDAVYSVLALFQPLSDSISVDYDRPVSDVYLNVIQLTLNEPTFFALLCEHRVAITVPESKSGWDEEERHIIPSWLPDLERRGPAKLVIHYEFYFASGFDHPMKPDVSLEGRTLILRSLYCTNVQILADNPDVATCEPDRYHWLRDWLLSSRRTLCTDTTITREEWIRCLSGNDINGVWYGWKVDVQDSELTAQGHQGLTTTMKAYDELPRTRKSLGDPKAQLCFVEDSEILLAAEAIVVMNSVIRMIQTGFQLCRFTCGRPGWVPETSLEGDTVHIPFGSRVPFVLRRYRADPSHDDNGLGKERYFTMVGTAYVHGVMAGELFEDEIEVEATAVTIYLY
ncbi:hypothetical protein H2198_002500 [Neophaeococcomyces mojaviensis]|uniref:Uncharacterized protein n=1 Tax=Neophaeococcomyces mojaviensis TaxID=3383035 RepID=A0ACC3AEJ0_9EURO|nr:hypothetical protein H2198_002500 [Knufia sp. JES_112]